MAASNTSTCRPCEACNKYAPANYWCIECHDMMCEDCNGHHSVIKSSNNHTVINIDNYRKLPESVLNISPLCQDHGMKYFHFCTSHEAPCCPECTQTTHKSCPKLQLLDEAIKTAKTCSMIDEVTKSMKEIISNLEKIISERGQNILGLQKQKREIEEKIGTIRKNVNKHIDVLEEKVLRELNNIEESQTKKLQESSDSLTAKLDMVKNKLEETTMLKQYATDLQTFLGTRELEKVIEKEKTCIEHLSKDGSLNIYELQCSINDKIQSITSDIQSFGSVSVISKPSTVRLTYDKDKQAQIFLSTPKLNRIKFENAIGKLESKFVIQGSKKTFLRGCSVFPNDKVVIADEGNRRVIILNENGTKEKEILISERGPYDVAVIDDRTFAVSTDKGVQIIDVNTSTVDKTFDIGSCDGLSYQDGVLYICGNKGTQDIISIVMSTGEQKTIIQERHDYVSYCAVAGDQLYYTRTDKGLQCYSITGEKKWEYEDTTQINNPLGVTVDGSGNVYLASYGYYQILMISPDGQRCRPILSGNDGIFYPWGLSYNKNKNELCVVCEDGQCFLYEIN